MNKKSYIYILTILISSFAGINSFSQEIKLKNISSALGLPSDKVYCITQDKEGYIWAATSKGVIRYNGIVIEKMDSQPNYPKEEIIQIHGSKNGKVWLYGLSGATYYWENEKFYSSLNDPSISRLQLKWMSRVFYDDIKEGSWLGNWQYGAYSLESQKKDTSTCLYITSHPQYGILIIGPKSIHSFNQYFHWNQPLTFDINSRFAKYKEGLLSISLTGDIVYCNLSTKKVEIVKADSSFKFSAIYCLLSDNNGTFYCGTTNGVFSFTIKDGTQKINSHLLKKKSISNILIDNQKNFWFTSLDNGIYFQSNLRPPVFKITDSSIDVSAFSVNNKIIFATKGKIVESNTKNVIYDFQTEFIEITSLIQDKNTLLVGSNEGLSKIYFDGKKEDFIYFNEELNEFRTLGSIKNVHVYGDTLYVASIRGVFIVPNFKNNLTGVRLNKRRVSDVIKHQNQLWFASEEGLYRLNDRKEILIQKGSFRCLSTLAGAIYGGTYGDGIYKWEDGRGNFLTTKLNSSQNNLICSSLFCYKSSKILAATNQGVFVIDSTSLIKELSENIGFSETNINNICVKNDTIYYSSKEGLFFLNYPTQKLFSPLPILYLDKVWVNNTKSSLNNLGNLKYNENSIRIVFNPICYSDASLTYEYSINNNWIKMQNPELVLGELSPGNYIIKVRAKSGYSNYSKPIIIKIVIHPPFWKTTWFQLLLLLCGIILIYLFFKIRVLTYNKDVVRDLLQIIIDKIKPQHVIYVKNAVNGDLIKMKINDIYFIEAARNYCEIHLKTSKVLVRGNIKELSERLAKEKQLRMVRIHRSYLINKDHITSFNGQIVKIEGHEIPSGKSEIYKNEFDQLKKQFTEKKI